MVDDGSDDDEDDGADDDANNSADSGANDGADGALHSSLSDMILSVPTGDLLALQSFLN